MIPITDEYIAGEFLVNGTHYIARDKKLVREVGEKARNYIKQIELGRMYSQINALKIRDKLLAR
jgi:hypothetical protein